MMSNFVGYIDNEGRTFDGNFQYDGAVGPKGEPGYTPQKGTDYFTPEDIAEIEGDVAAAINTEHAAQFTKLDGIEANAQVNILEKVSVNGVEQTVTDKKVNIAVPTNVSQLTNDSAYITKSVNNLDNYTTTSGMNTLLNTKINSSLKGAANGVAELDENGKVPSSQLPSYVDDVLEYNSTSAFPATGETGKIYVALDTNKTYRWSGTEYVEISSSLALGETSSTAYRGDRGATAYSHATDSGRLTTAKASGLYKISTTSEGHIGSATPVTTQDLLAYGINYYTVLTSDLYLEDGVNPDLDDGYYYTDEYDVYVNNEPMNLGYSIFYYTSAEIDAQHFTAYLYKDLSPDSTKSLLIKYDNGWGVQSGTFLTSNEIATSISAGSTNSKVVGAKLLYDELATKQGTLTAGSNISISSGVIAATDTTYSAFTGTDGSTAGTSGLVPAPATTDEGKYLGADGSWGKIATSELTNDSNFISSTVVTTFWHGTQVQYDAITTKDPTTLYLIDE